MIEKGNIQEIQDYGNRATIKINDKYYSTFSPEILKNIKNGDKVTFGYIEKTKDNKTYRNFAAIEKIGEETKNFSNGQQYKKSFQIKTITSTDPEEFDKLVSEYNETHEVGYTQTHITVIGPERIPQYTAILFFK